MERIFLIGARACGKTTAGRILAEKLGWRCADTDEMVQRRAGCSIADMVARDGWPVFREAEAGALQAACALTRVVVSTGGGMVLRADNRAALREGGIVFYLCAPAAVLASRLVLDPVVSQRPSLTGGNPAAEIAAVLAERDTLYRETAHHVVDACQPAAAVAGQMLRLLAAAG
ncbi:shikimate kinase AroL [Oleidesulfovibrio alaskensis]|jgi:shikimate kinase|uniref:shikimate kinase AroL n=1 Tax=Oleidesulfovibrio alaskensis TaxID=58180 RepID=UPI000400842E|nr:shikimate kinase AroL [Oleidesulfovibrio alaskensis]